MMKVCVYGLRGVLQLKLLHRVHNVSLVDEEFHRPHAQKCHSHVCCSFTDDAPERIIEHHQCVLLLLP